MEAAGKGKGRQRQQGPVRPSKAPEIAQEMPEEVTVVRPSITPSLSPEPTAVSTSVTAVSATPEISSMTEISTTPVVSITPPPEMSPVPTITQAPTITPAKRKPEQSSEEGTLSRPDHPDTVTNDKLIFVGDSRTEGIRDAVGMTVSGLAFREKDMIGWCRLEYRRSKMRSRKTRPLFF